MLPAILYLVRLALSLILAFAMISIWGKIARIWKNRKNKEATA